jgi:hypothetical protein
MLTWSITEKLSPPEDSKEEDPQHLPTGKTSKYYSCSESVDGKMVRSLV